MNQEAVGAEHSARTWSLKREWSRAFVVMLVLLLVVAVASIAGVRAVVNQTQGTALHLHDEAVAIAGLTTAIVAHEESAHALLSGLPVDRVAFVRQQQTIVGQFDRAVAVFPVTNNMRADIIEAHRSWQEALMSFNLWSTRLQALHGSHLSENPAFGAKSDHSAALLSGLQGPSLEAMNAGLARDVRLEYLLISGLAALFGIALAVTLYFRRRMSTDILEPVAFIHQGVLKLQGGDYDHRIKFARRDELGELTEAFNSMAGALHESHLTLTKRATHDLLTGLANRASLTERLIASFGPGSDRRARQESVLFIDIDDFKEVNDSFGHEGGDALLIQLATRLIQCVRPHDMVGRLGGDEFAIVVAEDVDGSVAVVVADQILGAIRAPFVINGAQVSVSVSIGLAQRRQETIDAAELLRYADSAMYMAKGGGKNRCQVFDFQAHQHMVSEQNSRTTWRSPSLRSNWSSSTSLSRI